MQSISSTRKKYRRVSYIIRKEDGRHRSGVNSIALNKGGELLFSASRDGIARCWRTAEAGPKARSVRTYDGHTDWVNDLVLVGNESALVTASSDTTIKVWGVSSERCLHTLTSHSDYVKALAYSPDRGFLASCGLDKDLYIWDVEVSSAPVAQLSGWSDPSVSMSSMPRRCSGHCDSVYCLATNRPGTLVVSGSPERVSAHAIGLVRIWDPRVADQVGRLKGHTDNVRCLLVSADGTKCLSGGSDATMKLWDLGQQRCIHSLAVHTDSVWALEADEGFGKVLSGGRDQAVYCTDLRTLDSTLLLRLAETPLGLALSPNQRWLWVATTGSSLSCWAFEPAWSQEMSGGPRDRRQSLHRLPSVARRGDLMTGRSPGLMPLPSGALSPPAWDVAGGPLPSPAMPSPTASPVAAAAASSSSHVVAMSPAATEAEPVPLLKGPDATIPGLAATTKFDLLENRRHVLTEDSDGNLALWHLPTAEKLRDLGRPAGGFDETRKALFREVHAPTWCSVDCRLGSLAVHLDFPQVFGAELYSGDAELNRENDPDDIKVNVGFKVLRALFRHWRQARAATRPSSGSSGGGVGGSGGGSGGGGGAEDGEGLPEDDEEPEDDGLEYLVPDQMLVVVGEGGHGVGGGGGAAVCARRVKDWGAADPTVVAGVPDWVAESLLRGYPASERGERLGEPPKVSFNLLAYPDCDIRNLPPGKLNAPQILRCRKVLSYAAGKLGLSQEESARGRPGGGGGNGGSSEDVTDWLELVCNERVVPADTNLMTIRKFFARNADELTLFYRWKDPPTTPTTPPTPSGPYARDRMGQ